MKSLKVNDDVIDIREENEKGNATNTKNELNELKEIDYKYVELNFNDAEDILRKTKQFQPKYKNKNYFNEDSDTELFNEDTNTGGNNNL